MSKSEIEITKENLSLREMVLDYYKDEGLIYKKPINLVPESVDKTVTFTSASINGMKEYIRGEKAIPEEGFFTIQQCLRTQNLDHRYERDILPRFGSYFNMFGSLCREDQLEDVYSRTINFVNQTLNIPKRDIIIHRSSEHNIFDSLEKTETEITWKEDQINWYNWTYGENEVRGIGITINIPNKGVEEESQEIGNIVLILNNEKPIGIEWGFGLETTQSRILGLSHPLLVSPIGKRYLEQMKMTDNLAKDILYLDYVNILSQLDNKSFSEKDGSKYIRRTIKQLFQGLSIQMLYRGKDFRTLRNLNNSNEGELFFQFSLYYNSFINRYFGFSESYKRILNNHGVQRSEDQIKRTLAKSAKNYGFFDKQAEAIINFLSLKHE